LVGLVALAAVVAMVSLGAANTFTLVGGGTSPAGTGDTFVGMSPDASRIYFETNERLLATDTDSTYDVYRWVNGVHTQISLGNGDNGFLTDAQFLGESADGTRVFFQTRESLSGSDTDTEVDIYQNAGGVITLLSGGGGWPVTFKGAYGSTIFFETPDPLDAADNDSFVDVYRSTGGAPTLVTADTPTAEARFGTASATGDTVIIATAEGIADSDGGVAKSQHQKIGGPSESLRCQ